MENFKTPDDTSLLERRRLRTFESPFKGGLFAITAQNERWGTNAGLNYSPKKTEEKETKTISVFKSSYRESTTD